jgi:uncharacterized DUF497 family protein
MWFEWDVNKNRTNKRKHGVSFEVAALVFDDPHIISLPDEFDREERWLSIGLVKGVHILAVVHTWKEEGNEEIIRIISGRKAAHEEIQEYENQFQKD